MRNRNISIQIVLFFCFIPLVMFTGSCTTLNLKTSTEYSWTKDVDSLLSGKTGTRFWSTVRSQSNMASAYKQLGGFYQKQGKHRKAIAEYIKAIKIESGDATLYNSLAMSYDALKEFSFAEMAYKDAISRAPEKAYLYNNYGYSRLLSGDVKRAVALFEKATSLEGKSPRIKNNLAIAVHKTEQNEISKSVESETPQLLPDTYVAKRIKEDNTEKNGSVPIAETVEVAGNKILEQESTVEKNILDTPFSENNTKEIVADVLQQVENVSAKEIEISEDVSEQLQVSEAIVLVDPSTVDNTRFSSEVEVKALMIIDSNPMNDDLPSTPSALLPEATEAPLRLKAIKEKVVIDTNSEQNVRTSKKVAIEVSNGNGVTGMAARSAAYFKERGQSVRRITNAPHFGFKKSIVFYRAGYLQEAGKIASIVPGYQELKQVESLGRPEIGVKVLLGKDMATIQFPESMEGITLQEISTYNKIVSL